MTTKGKSIKFCQSCKWNIEEKDIDLGYTNYMRCPKCGGNVWNIFKYKHYEKGKVVDIEEGLTDNDENFINISLSRLNQITKKGLKLTK